MINTLWKVLKPVARFTYKTVKKVVIVLFWIFLIIVCLVLGFAEKKWGAAAAIFGIALVIYVIRYLVVKIKEIKKQNPPPCVWK